MRVLHVYRTYFPDPPGGLQEAIRQISLATRDHGVESRIFTLSPRPAPKEIHLPEGVVSRCRSWAAPASCDLGGAAAFCEFGKLAKWAEVIHYHFPWPFADILHLLYGRGTPSVMTYHSDIIRQRCLGYVYGLLLRHTVRSMAAVVATSPAYAATSPVLTTMVPQRRLRIIPLGIADHHGPGHGPAVGEDPLPALSLATEPFILALGVLRYYKGLHTLIRAAAAIKAKVVIAGAGPEENRLKALAAELGATNVVFLGFVAAELKLALLRRCRALVLPSHLRAEAFGMVLVEAAMFGKPMVCCEVGSGTSFINVHGETGYVVPPESPTFLAEALNRLLADQALAAGMGLKARRRYERLFSAEALGRSYAELYREVFLETAP